MSHVIALLGAESTGKTTLARQLAETLRAGTRRVALVEEYLREFCEVHGRTPTREEQLPIAQEQARRIDAAAATHEIVVAADRPNGGYCVDIWHHTRGANDASMIEALEPERIFAIQMNDGPLTPDSADYKPDCLANRVPPGGGEFDCVGFIRLLATMGVDAPISLEVCSSRLCGARRPASADSRGRSPA